MRLRLSQTLQGLRRDPALVSEPDERGVPFVVQFEAVSRELFNPSRDGESVEPDRASPAS